MHQRMVFHQKSKTSLHFQMSHLLGTHHTGPIPGGVQSEDKLGLFFTTGTIELTGTGLLALRDRLIFRQPDAADGRISITEGLMAADQSYTVSKIVLR
ncbi:MAG: hypothetical protein ABSH48_13490 [Verrucomicrobiota bacterium]|jgi:hypothetical protein